MSDLIKSSLENNKKIVRNKLRQAVRTLSNTEKLEKSKIIFKKITESKMYKDSSVIMCYISLPDEPNIFHFVDQIFSDDKKVVIPYCHYTETIMGISEIKDLYKDLSLGKYGILEPMESLRNNFDGDIDLVIVPGVGFDLHGNRLGRGKGYYDRFLAELTNETKTIGVGFSIQLLDLIPFGKHDVSLDYIFTEDKSIKVD